MKNNNKFCITILLLILVVTLLCTNNLVIAENNNNSQNIIENTQPKPQVDPRENYMEGFERHVVVDGFELELKIENRKGMTSADYKFKKEDLYYEIVGFKAQDDTRICKLIEYYDSIIVNRISRDFLNTINNIKVLEFSRNIEYKDLNSVICGNELEEVILPDTILEIYPYMFYNCTSLKTVKFGKKVNRICNNAFEGTGIENIIIPNSVLVIDDEAFKNCPELKEIIFGENVQISGSNIFEYCTSLKTVTLNNGIRKLGEFFEQTNMCLDKIELAENLEYIENTLNAKTIIVNSNVFSNIITVKEFKEKYSYTKVLYFKEGVNPGIAVEALYDEVTSDLSGYKKYCKHEEI